MPGFDITKSKFTDEKLTTLEKDLKKKGFQNELGSIIGIGPKSCEKLKSKGVANAYQLVGKFMSFWEEGSEQDAVLDAFYAWYKKTTNEGGHAHSVVTHLMFALHYGLTDLEVELPPAVEEQQRSRLDPATVQKFIDAELSPKLSELTGVGPKGVEGLNEHGITTSWQLCGLFLETMDMEKFSDTLKQCGIPASWASLVAYMIALKCKTGVKKEVAVSDLNKMFVQLAV